MANDLSTFYGATYIPDRLVIRFDPSSSQKGTLLTGQNLLRGSLLGIITASGLLTLSTSAAVDGSQIPDRILAEDANASLGPVDALCYLRGQFDSNYVTFGAGQTVANTYQTLRGKGIDLIPAQPVNAGT